MRFHISRDGGRADVEEGDEGGDKCRCRFADVFGLHTRGTESNSVVLSSADTKTDTIRRISGDLQSALDLLVSN